MNLENKNLSVNEKFEKMCQWLDSPECEEYTKKFVTKYNRNLDRIDRASNYINNLTSLEFENLLNKLIINNGDSRKNKLWDKHIQPYPTHLMYMLFKVVENIGYFLDKDNCPKELISYFNNSVFSYNGYIFSSVTGQVVIRSIYKYEQGKLKYLWSI